MDHDILEAEKIAHIIQRVNTLSTQREYLLQHTSKYYPQPFVSDNKIKFAIKINFIWSKGQRSRSKLHN